VTREIELKLEVDPDDLPLLLDDGLFANAESHSGHQSTVYYDTSDERLKKQGYTLRVRSVGSRFVQTVKPIGDAVGLLSREEIESDVPSMEPDLRPLAEHPIHRLLKRGEHPALVPVMRSDVTRTTWEIDRHRRHIRVDLDHGTISAKERSREFAELELELIEGSPASLVMAARRIADHVPVRLSVLTKADRGYLLSSGALGKVAKSGKVRVHTGMTVAEAFEVVVHNCLKHYRLNEPLVIRKCKAEALHQCRVAMRRLRSAFTLFRPAVEDVEFQHLRHELRWFTSQLGDARNLDVYLQRELPEAERAELIAERDRAYDAVADVMNAARFRRLLIDIAGWTALGAWRGGKVARRSIGTFANARLDKLWHSIANAGHNIVQMDETTRHGLRIEVKKLRYGTEFFQGLYPHAQIAEKQFSAAMEELQEFLGNLNDLANARGMTGASTEDDWLIGSYEERAYLKSAEESFRALKRVGPFWRTPGKAGTAA